MPALGAARFFDFWGGMWYRDTKPLIFRFFCFEVIYMAQPFQAGETVTVHLDATMFSQKQDQAENPINSIFLGAKAACDVLLYNFRIIQL